MPSRFSKKALRKQSAAELAAQCVKEWDQNVLGSTGALLRGHVNQVTFDDVFERVQDALEREYAAERGRAATKDEDLRAEMFALKAGYPVGVQVGLRLAGGVR